MHRIFLTAAVLTTICIIYASPESWRFSVFGLGAWFWLPMIIIPMSMVLHWFLLTRPYRLVLIIYPVIDLTGDTPDNSFDYFAIEADYYEFME